MTAAPSLPGAAPAARSAPAPLPAPLVREHEGFLVLRDDLLYGGTKRRALERCLEPGREYVFASPAEGHAQLALALAARSCGAKATLFVAKRSFLAPRTALAQEQGALIFQVPHGRLSNTQAKARWYAERQGAELLALGLRSISSEVALIQVCEEANYALEAGGHLMHGRRVFFAIGSGTLARCLARGFPDSELHGLIVGHQPSGDALPASDSFHAHVCVQPFSAWAPMPPPYPSSPNYDAKVWALALRLGQPGDLIWNVA